jgi:anti-sigma regulatory factor (Ser/Thr protein kinase)
MEILSVSSELESLETIRGFLKAGLERLSLSEIESFKIELSIVEICTNIIKYAYPQERGEIALRIWQELGKLFIEIRDTGVPFDPTRAKDPDITEIIRKRKKGGLGIFLSRKFMDGFGYRRENDQNVLTISKVIRQAKR